MAGFMSDPFLQSAMRLDREFPHGTFLQNADRSATAIGTRRKALRRTIPETDGWAKPNLASFARWFSTAP
jgi:hypothetical protein